VVNTTAGTATAPDDFIAISNQTFTIPAGQTTFNVPVTIVGDTVPESTENFTLTVSSPSSNAVLGATTTATVTITDNDSLPTLNISPVTLSQNEGTSVNTNFVFTVTRAGDLTGTSAVNFAVNGTGANPANAADFVGGVLPTGTVSFAAGQSTATITVPVNGDNTVEPDETFTVNLSSATGATIGVGTATGTIVNDDTLTGFTNVNLDGRGTIQSPETLDAGTGAFNYIDTIFTANNVIINNFGADDQIDFDDTSILAIANDGAGTRIVANFNGQVSEIFLTGVGIGGLIFSLDTFNALPVGDIV
jgi:hypothetical protein